MVPNTAMDPVASSMASAAVVAFVSAVVVVFVSAVVVAFVRDASPVGWAGRPESPPPIKTAGRVQSAMRSANP